VKTLRQRAEKTFRVPGLTFFMDISNSYPYASLDRYAQGLTCAWPTFCLYFNVGVYMFTDLAVDANN